MKHAIYTAHVIKQENAFVKKTSIHSQIAPLVFPDFTSFPSVFVRHTPTHPFYTFPNKATCSVQHVDV